MNKKITLIIALTMAVVMLFAGCVQDNKPVPQPDESKAPASVEPTKEPVKETKADVIKEIKNSFLQKANAVEVTDKDITFKDGSDREKVTVPRNLKKVAVLYGSYVCLWSETGPLPAGIVGGKSSTKLYKNVLGRDITKDDGVNVLVTSSSGTKWDAETIVAFQPELIICSTAMSGYDTISGPAEAANIPVVAVDYNSLEDYMKWFKVFANINGHPEKFDEVAMKVLDEVAEVVYKIKDEKGPNVISLFNTSKSIKANLAGTNVGALLNHLNAVNMADTWENEKKSTRIQFNLEQIVAANPDYILIQTHTDLASAKQSIEEKYGEDAVWNSIEAVKNNKVYFLPRELFFYRPNNRYGETYKSLAKMLYPNVDFDN